MSRQWLPSIRGRRLQVLFLGAILYFLWVSHLTVGITRSADNHDDGSRDIVRRRGSDTATAFWAPPSSYPIYILEDSFGEKLKVLDWRELSNEWRSISSFFDLLKSSRSLTAETILPSSIDTHRNIFILHNHPKMASTTLRRACWENLKSSCNVVSSSRDPMGYSDPNDLAMLMEQCRNTHHFCVGGWHYRADNFPNQTSRSLPSPATVPITFLHMFPFRNFNDWAESALKQIFVGHSIEGCREASKRLDSCNGWFELDFEKYSKRTMASMIEIINLHYKTEPQRHIFFLYDFREVQPTLAQLSHVFNTSMLPYLDMKYKQKRRDGSCPRETLKKFHDCFDEELLQL